MSSFTSLYVLGGVRSSISLTACVLFLSPWSGRVYVHWGAQLTPRIVSIALAADKAVIQQLLVDAQMQLVLDPHQVVVLTEVRKY